MKEDKIANDLVMIYDELVEDAVVYWLRRCKLVFNPKVVRKKVTQI